MRSARFVLAMAVLLAVLFSAACVEIEPRPGFDEVQAQVERRAGERVAWRDGGEGEAELVAAVEALLARPLDPAGAAQVALLENRDLQAVYQELGISRAELVQAGLLKNPIFDAEFEVFGAAGTDIFEFGVVWDFLDIFYVPLRVAIAEQRYEAVKHRVTAAVIDLAVETRLAMIDLQALEAEKALIADRLGRRGEDDPARAWLRLDWAAADAEAAVQREELNALMGLFGDAVLWTAAPGPGATPGDVDLAAVEDEAVAANLDLAAATRDIAALAESIGLDRAERALPHGKAGISAEKTTDDTWLFGPAVSVSVPVLDSGKAAKAAATSRLRRAYDRYWALAVRVRAEARAARARYAAAVARARHLDGVVADATGDDDRLDDLRVEAVRARRDAHRALAVLDAVRRGRVPEARFGLGAPAYPLDSDSLRISGARTRYRAN